jgi:hypothetical protein
MLMDFHALPKVPAYLSMENVHRLLGGYPWINLWLISEKIHRQTLVIGLKSLVMEVAGVIPLKIGATHLAQLITR